VVAAAAIVAMIFSFSSRPFLSLVFFFFLGFFSSLNPKP
jgi:hypothetical protein